MAKVQQAGAAVPVKSHWIHRIQNVVPEQGTFFIVPTSESIMHVPLLFTHICVNKSIALHTLSVREKSLREIKELLESSFLGQSNWYGIWDVELSAKNVVQPLLEYLRMYKGPHTLIVCFSADFIIPIELKKSTVMLPVELTLQQCVELCAELPARICNVQTLQSMIRGETHISLAQFLTFVVYAPVLGRTLVPVFKTQYLPRIVKAEMGSLFTFTDYFWQKNVSVFYVQWSQLKDLYAPQFWLAFWSDQFFRAYCYTYAMKDKQTVLAQQFATRKLSFFYLKTGWQKVNTESLMVLHDMIYRIDYTSKTGGTTDMLEYLYQHWFTYS